MGVRRVGSKLVAENADRYVRDMTGADNATQKFTKTLKGIGLVAAGIAAAKMFSGVAQEAIAATAAQEQLSMSMTSLVAKEIRTADQTVSMADAMDQASGRAEDLLGWIQDLAIKSPFSQEGVASAFRTALAYGFTSTEAQRLTAATIDFATATGQSVGVMNQVALALGQIKAKGKLAGQEMLQLVNAGFSVNPILEKMGYTTEDVSKGLVKADEFLLAFTESLESDFGGAAERSSETINGLIDSLGDLKQVGLRELFGPAIQATLPLLSAFVTKFQELMPSIRATGQLIGQMTTFVVDNREAFLAGAVAAGIFFTIINAGSIISAVTAGIGLLTTAVVSLAGAMAVLVSPLGILAIALGAIGGGLFAMRKELTFTANTASSAAGQIAGDWGEMGDKVRQTANQTGEEAHSWGYNLVIQFANGMAKAVSAVLQVLIDLGNTISYWLSPGSPPRIAPDIDKWGTAAMDQFIGGFASADFSVLKTAGQQMERYLRSDPQGADLGGLADMRKNLRTAVDEFSRTGMVSASVLNQFDPALQSYVSAMFAAEAANKKVAEAQEALSAVTEKYQTILNPLNAELDAIANRRQDIIDQQRESELQAIIADENAPALAKELAQMELREIELKRQIRTTEEQQSAEEEKAQAALDAAMIAAEAAQDELTRQQEILNLRIEDNALLAEQAGLLDAGAGAAGRMANGLKGAVDAAGGLGSTLADAFSGFGEGIAAKAEQLLADIKAPFSGIGEQFDQLKLTWAQVVIDFIAWSNPYLEQIRNAQTTWSGNLALMRIAAELLQIKVANVISNIKSKVADATSYITEQWGEGGTWSGIMDNLKTAVQLVGDKWGEIWGEGGTYDEIFSWATDKITEAWGEEGIWRTIIDDLGLKIIGFKDSVLTPLKRGLLQVNTAIDNVRNAIQRLAEYVANLDLSALTPFISNSPAPMAVGLSQINKQMQQLSARELPSLQRQTMVMDVPTTQSQAAINQATTYNYTTMNMGGNNINNGMDMAAFEAAVLRVVNGAL